MSIRSVCVAGASIGRAIIRPSTARCSYALQRELELGREKDCGGSQRYRVRMLVRVFADSVARSLVPRSIRNWLRSPRASIRYAAAMSAGLFGHSQKLPLAPGLTVRCHQLSARQFSMFRNDPELANEVRSFLDRCRPGMRLLDVGAHHGLFSIAACLHEPSACALAVEASARACRIMKVNVRLNRAQTRIRLNCIAAGDEDGQLSMLD